VGAVDGAVVVVVVVVVVVGVVSREEVGDVVVALPMVAVATMVVVVVGESLWMVEEVCHTRGVGVGRVCCFRFLLLLRSFLSLGHVR
jgi:hypothetical protein